LTQEMFRFFLKELIEKIEADRNLSTEKLIQLVTSELNKHDFPVEGDQLLQPIHE